MIFQWIPAMAFEFCAWLHSFVFAPWAFSKSFHRPVGASSGTPILLVHGYLHCSSVWVYYKRKFAKAGFGPIYTINLKPALGSIQDYAQQIRAKAEEIESETGNAKLILIGHSMGGLACGTYAASVAPPEKELALISLGSPWDGTVLAQFMPGHNAKEMRRHSPFLKHLLQQLSHKKTLPRYHIATTTDQIVLPWRSSLKGSEPHQTLILDSVGHLSILYSRKAADQVTAWINFINR